MSRPPDDLPKIPRNEDGEPVFGAPWQAQAFAIAVALHAKGTFTWSEWAEELGRNIAEGDNPDGNDGYYSAWLTTLESLLQRKRVLGTAEMAERKDAWDRAAKATPHGRPILLGNDVG